MDIPENNMNSITTKTGDDGKTKLLSGEEVSKNSLRPDTYGDIDELVSVMGIARCVSKKKEVQAALRYLQRKLFVVSSEIASENESILKKRIGTEDVAEIDSKRTELEESIKIPEGFIVPCGSLASAHIDHARALSRRCERKIVGLYEKKMIKNKKILVWMNRLSDYLYLLARYEEGDQRVMKDSGP